MAVTLTRNLKLRVDSNLTASAKYNLERLDLLGSTFLTDSTDTLNIRSQTDIALEPNSADVGGSGTGGSLTIGSGSHSLSAVSVFASAFNLNSPLSLLDQASGGSKSLLLRYKSDLNGLVDTVADRTLSVDLEGGSRSFVLAGDLSFLGGSLTLTIPGSSTLTAPAIGTLATLAGSEAFTNKSIDATLNTLSNIGNASVASNAAIAYSKLNLAGSLLNSDVANGAAIAYTKLSLGNSLLDSDVSVSAAITRSKLANGTAGYVAINSPAGVLTEEPYLSRSRGGAGQDQTNVTYPSSGVLVTTSASQVLTGKSIDGSSNTLSNVPYSALSLTGQIVNSDISPTAAIPYAKLNLSSSVVNADISALASISRSKVAAAASDHVLINDGSGNLSSEAQLAVSRGGTGAATANAALNAFLPAQSGNTGKVLRSDGSNVSWAAVGVGSVTSVALTAPAEFSVSGSPITTNGTLAISKATQNANSVWAGPTTGAATAPAFRSLVLADLPSGIPYSSLTLTGSIHDADIQTGASISLSKLETVTASRALQSNGSGAVSASSITSTELGYLSGVTSGVQAQIDGKQTTDSDLTALAGLSTTGLIVRTGSGTAATRTLVAGTGISLSNASGVAGDITVTSTVTQYDDEAAQDAVGTILTDTGSIDFTYNDATPSITATVIPGGVDHDQLLNYSANKHVDHTAVSISTAANSGLAGGGTIASTRSLSIDPTNAPSVSPAAGDILLFADVSNSNSLSRTTLQTVLDLGGGKVTATWAPSDGTSKVVTHSFGTTDVSVNVYDIDSGEEVLIDSTVRTSSNVTTLTASQAPTGSGLKVIVRK